MISVSKFFFLSKKKKLNLQNTNKSEAITLLLLVPKSCPASFGGIQEDTLTCVCLTSSFLSARALMSHLQRLHYHLSISLRPPSKRKAGMVGIIDTNLWNRLWRQLESIQVLGVIDFGHPWRVLSSWSQSRLPHLPHNQRHTTSRNTQRHESKYESDNNI